MPLLVTSGSGVSVTITPDVLPVSAGIPAAGLLASDITIIVLPLTARSSFGEFFVSPAPRPIIIPPVFSDRREWEFIVGPKDGGYNQELTEAYGRTVTLRSPADAYHEASFTIDGRHSQITSATAAGQIIDTFGDTYTDTFGSQSSTVQVSSAPLFHEMQDDLHVLRNGSPLFRGRIIPAQDELDGTRHTVAATAMDYREVLRRRFLDALAPKSWTAKEQYEICWDMIDWTQKQPSGDLGITRGIGKDGTGKERTLSYSAGDMIGDRISEMGGWTHGFDWHINPYGSAGLRFDMSVPHEGVNRGVVLEYGGGMIRSISRSFDPATFANSIYFTSGKDGVGPEVMLSGEVKDGTAKEGRWEYSEGTDIQTQSALDDYASALLNDRMHVLPTYTVQMRQGAWDGPAHIGLGDTVRLRIDSGRLAVDTDCRVVEMAFTLGESGEEDVTLTLDRIPFRVVKVVRKLERKLRILLLKIKV